jgi:VWFA-related protein
VASLLCAFVSVGAQQSASAPLSQQPVTIIAKTTLVPIDVRVLDHTGKPITDLKQEDFIVYENGVRQEVQHFAARGLVAEAPSAGTKLRRASDAYDLAPQDGRIFLLLMGRGFLQPVSKAFDASIDFVRNRLLPQDEVAVMAWNRATDFTTDHEAIAKVLEAMRTQTPEIEANLRQYYSGLAALYGTSTLPPFIQAGVDKVFGATRTVPVGQATDAAQVTADQKRTADALAAQGIDQMRAAQAVSAGNAMASPMGVLPDAAASIAQASLDTSASFDEYVATARQTSQDVGNLYSGIEYLRFVEGEKHLVFFSDDGLYLPRYENDKNISARASDARVVIDTIQTGGTAPYNPFSYAQIGASFFKGQAIQTLGSIAELSGGQTLLFSYADKALTSIAQATTFDYQLGYYPSNTTWDGSYREIKVTTNRKGVDVFFRHGYYADKHETPLTPRQMIALTRVTAAAGFGDDIRDIKIATKIEDYAEGKERGVALDLHMDPKQIQFIVTGGRRVASLDVVVFCNDPKQDILVEKLWRTVQLALTEDEYQQAIATGLSVKVRAPVESIPRIVRVIVYDPAADRIGSTFARLH